MNLETLISSNAVRNTPDIKSKKRALETLAEVLASQLSDNSPSKTSSEVSSNVAADDENTNANSALEIFQLLTEREKLGSTGLGHGVALPHARTELTDTAIAAFLKLDNGIDFDSPDQQATDLIFALLVPQHYTDEHLKILAHLASLFSNEKFCQTIRHADSEQLIFENLINWQPATQAS